MSSACACAPLNCAPFHRAKADYSSVTLASRGLQRKGEHSALWVDCGSQQRDSVFVFHHWYHHQPCPPSLSSLHVHIDTRELDQLFVNLPIEITKPFSLPFLLSVPTVLYFPEAGFTDVCAVGVCSSRCFANTVHRLRVMTWFERIFYDS